MNNAIYSTSFQIIFLIIVLLQIKLLTNQNHLKDIFCNYKCGRKILWFGLSSGLKTPSNPDPISFYVLWHLDTNFFFGSIKD